MILQGPPQRPTVETYLAELTGSEDPAVVILHFSATEELSHAPHSLPDGSPLVDVVAQSESMLENGDWIGLAHLTVRSAVQAVLADSRPVGIGAAGNVGVLWPRQRPWIEVRARNGDVHGFRIAPG